MRMRSGRKTEEGRRQLVKVADIAVEIFPIPLFVVPFPLQVTLSVHLLTVWVTG